MNSRTDEELIREIQGGSIVSYEEMVKRYQQRLFRFAMKFVFNESDAEEIVQDTFMAVYVHIDRIDYKQKFYSYIFAIAKNFAISCLRSKKQSISLENIEIAIEDEMMYEHLSQKDQHDDIAKVLSSLDEKYRSILTMYYFEDLSYEEMSQKTHIPLNTVRTRLRRAKDEVKKLL